jgi:hypothetical protein
VRSPPKKQLLNEQLYQDLHPEDVPLVVELRDAVPVLMVRR